MHILDAINYIESFLEGKTKDDFFNELQLRFAIERQLEITGEAANHLSESLKNENQEIEWRKIVAFRNFLIHEYFGVDLELLWGITQNNLEDLKLVVSKMVSKDN
ncbi:MAG TPA: HepT-like ribonuclease domain-containing protein [Leadbetterella sp.]|nr:HepT-like ribonuclease domain-containing protein [Leadbetterella sp.]